MNLLQLTWTNATAPPPGTASPATMLAEMKRLSDSLPAGPTFDCLLLLKDTADALRAAVAEPEHLRIPFTGPLSMCGIPVRVARDEHEFQAMRVSLTAIERKHIVLVDVDMRRVEHFYPPTPPASTARPATTPAEPTRRSSPFRINGLTD